MKRIAAILVAVFALTFSGASWAKDMTVEGTVSGYTCAVLGKACPVDREDPVIAVEKVFVVIKADGSFWLVPNVDRAILARHLTEKVRVTGTLDDKYKSVTASRLEVFVTERTRTGSQNPNKISPLMSKDGWKTVWSTAMEEEARKMLEGY